MENSANDFDLGSLADRDYELAVAAYLLHNPARLKKYHKHLQAWYFKYHPVRIIVSQWLEWTRRGIDLPGRGLARTVMQQFGQKSGWADLYLQHILDDMDTIYSGEFPFDVVSDHVDLFICRREVQELAEELQATKTDQAFAALDAIADKIALLRKTDRRKAEYMDPGVMILQDKGINDLVDLIMDAYTGRVVPTGWSRVDSVLQGGSRPGELTLVMAPTNVGKTFYMTNMAVNNALAGLRVVYYVMDNSLSEYSSRIFSRLMRRSMIADAAIREMELNRLKTLITRNRDVEVPAHVRSNLIIRKWPPQMFTPNDLYAHIDTVKVELKRLDLAAGVPVEDAGRLDGVYIDYLEKMLPNKQTNSDWLDISQMTDELIKVAETQDLAIIAATQTDTAGQKAVDAKEPVVKGWMTSRSKAKNNHASNIMIIHPQSEMEEIEGTQRISLDKVRGPIKKVFFHMKVDVYTQTITEDLTQDPSKDITPMANRSNRRKIPTSAG